MKICRNKSKDWGWEKRTYTIHGGDAMETGDGMSTQHGHRLMELIPRHWSPWH